MVKWEGVWGGGRGGVMRMEWGHEESVENQLSILSGDLGDSGKDV